MTIHFRAALLALTLAPAMLCAAPARTPVFDSSIISGLGARNIGSAAMSGRISSLDAVTLPDGKLMVWVGAASGGVWKSLDGATTFTPVFDDQPVQSIGAVEIDRRNVDTVWVGTGEAWTRNSVSIGDGIYKTTDGGDTWQHLGLAGSERIAEIRIDPRASDTVYACVTGRLWSDSLERGVYRTRDGGKTWQHVLKAPNASTGCASLSLDEKNPDVLYAALWDFRRKGWTFRSGGESPTAPSASALMVTRDGGTTWTEVTPEKNKGFAQKPYGRIAVNVAPSDSKRVYAFVESPQSALYVSDDGGATWEARDKSQWMVWRPFYFARMTVDPNNADRVFKDDGNLILSEDAGRSFSVVGGFEGMHGDIHDVWVNPANSKHVISGDDGGLWQSHDGGSKWWKGENLPISQFYHVSVDDEDPYHVYGGLQDNSSWIGDSAYPGGITNSRWENMYGGDGFWMFSDPADSNYLYTEYQGGAIARVHKHTHEARDIQPKARAGEKLRFNWNTPLHLSPHEKGTLYMGSQFLFRTRDQGQTWERISPDLTTNDPQKQRQEETGGVTVDNSAAEMHTTIYSISESPQSAGTIWVGTDDGNVQLTRDAGKTWTNVTGNLKGVPAASWVSWVEASRHDPATAYVTFDRHTFGDHEPWVYVTRNFGKTWQPLVTPQDARGVRGYAHVIKEDLQQPNLLFLGTELGLWVSIDGGQQWAAFKGDKFPAVAVRDLVIQPRDNDLVIATHGRGIWIIDDITSAACLDRRAHGAGSGIRRGAARAAAHLRTGRLGQWLGGVRGRESSGRRSHQLLPAHAPPVRQPQARDPRLQRARRRRAPGQQAARPEPGRMVDAREAAARAAGRATRVRRHAGPARAAGHLHGPHDQGRPGVRAAVRGRPRPSRQLHGRAAQAAVRCRHACAQVVRRGDRRARAHPGIARGCSRSGRGRRRGRGYQGQARRVRLQGRRGAQAHRGDEGRRRDHRRGAPARTHRPAVRRDHGLRGCAGQLSPGAHRRARGRAR